MRWTDERVAELKRRWKAGETGGMIGRALGVSRSAVLGKLNRLGMLADLPSFEIRRRHLSALHSAPVKEKMRAAWQRRREARL